VRGRSGVKRRDARVELGILEEFGVSEESNGAPP
jgi:hypothetical protein